MLDRALAKWEADRDAECLPMYQWSNLLGRDDAISPIELAAYRWFARKPGGATEILDVFSRRRSPTRVFSADRAIRWIVAAARDPAVPAGELWQTVWRDLRRERDRILEQRLFVRRRRRSEQMAHTPADLRRELSGARVVGSAAASGVEEATR
jgi:hypothetical protein